MAQGIPSGQPTEVDRNDRRDELGGRSPLIDVVSRWPLSGLAAIYITAYLVATLLGSESGWVGSSLAFLPFNLLAALTAGLASRRSGLHGATRRALRWLSVASACTALGNIAWFLVETRLGRDPTDTAVTLIYLAYYPPAIAAVMALPVIRLRPSLNPKALLDIAILLVASVVATWLTVLLMPRQAHGPFGTINTLGFAFGSLVMMFVLARAVLLHRVRDVGPGFPVLVAGLFGQTLLDLVFPQAPLSDTLLGQRGENLAYALSYGVIVLGCEMYLRRPTAAESPGLLAAQRDPLLALPYLATVLVLMPQAAVIAQRWSSPLGPLVVASTLIGLLLLARQAVALRERAVLRERLSQAQRLEALGRFAGGIAHDFNNVLSVVYADIELASSVLPPDSPARPELEEALTAATRAAALIRQLLTLSRYQRARIETVDLDRVMKDAERMLRPLLGEAITLHAVSGTERCFVSADAGQLEQVLLNLVINARDAMPEGGVITIETGLVEVDRDRAEPLGLQPGSHASLIVRDTGQGMTREIQSRIFEPFFTTKPVGKGTGLGLAMVFGAVSAFGGAIEVSSAPGKGSRFTVLLPRAVVPSDSAKSWSPPSLGGTETILVVEDDMQVRHITRRVLEAHGYTVLEACDGADALIVFDHEGDHLDLVLTDVRMPVMGGLELAKRLRDERPTLPVVFQSGYAYEAGNSGSLRPGDFFLQKPSTSDELLGRIRDALDYSGRAALEGTGSARPPIEPSQ